MQKKKSSEKESPKPKPELNPPLPYFDLTAGEMLAWLATEGCIPEETPDWATGGTNFEKLHLFLLDLQNNNIDISQADECMSAWRVGKKINFSDYSDDEDE
jgi:hypothetical protein